MLLECQRKQGNRSVAQMLDFWLDMRTKANIEPGTHVRLPPYMPVVAQYNVENDPYGALWEVEGTCTGRTLRLVSSHRSHTRLNCLPLSQPLLAGVQRDAARLLQARGHRARAVLPRRDGGAGGQARRGHLQPRPPIRRRGPPMVNADRTAHAWILGCVTVLQTRTL